MRTLGGGGAADPLPEGDGDATEGARYRVHTAELPEGGTVTVGLPEAATTQAVARLPAGHPARRARRRGRGGRAGLAAGRRRAAAGAGAARPHGRPLPGAPGPADRAALTAPPVDAAAETVELASAVAGLVDRVAAARAESESALASARDFAAAASHELRTPLTALRTDLDVLAAHPDLPPDQVRAVVAELRSTSERIEATLTASGSWASGELGRSGPAEVVDLADVVDRAVAGVPAHRTAGGRADRRAARGRRPGARRRGRAAPGRRQPAGQRPAARGRAAGGGVG